ncbi:hypothetical protein AOY86_25530 [Escherichia coli]|nr:hypothetical protein AOY86_25530 [Escherichia coli]
MLLHSYPFWPGKGAAVFLHPLLLLSAYFYFLLFISMIQIKNKPLSHEVSALKLLTGIIFYKMAITAVINFLIMLI